MGWFPPALIPRTGQTQSVDSVLQLSLATPRDQSPALANNAVDTSGFMQAGEGRAAISENGSRFQLGKAKDNSL